MNTIKICTLIYNNVDLNAIQSVQSKNGKLTAAFFKKSLWDQYRTISIGFIKDLKGNKNTSKRLLSDIISSSTQTMTPEIKKKVDPLQLELMNDTNITIEDAFKKIILKRIKPMVNLHFDFIDPDDVEKSKNANIRISFFIYSGDQSSWSLLGKECLNNDFKNRPITMNIGWIDYTFVSTVLHEFGHSLGLIHEHSSPFKNQIQWNREKVYEYYEKTQGWSKKDVDSQVLNVYDENVLNGSEFDPESIMLYFYPKELTINNKGTSQNLRLSITDLLWIYKTYPFDGKGSDEFFVREFYKKIYGVKSSNYIFLLLFIMFAIVVLYILIKKR